LTFVIFALNCDKTHFLQFLTKYIKLNKVSSKWEHVNGACLLEHDSSCQVSIENDGTDNIQYGLRVEIMESKKIFAVHYS